MASTAASVNEIGAGGRLHALDAVRAGALLLGIVFHASMSFLPGDQMWLTRDRESPTLYVLFFVTHIFRMSLFFLIAGFFGRMACERRGLRGFVRDRLKRIVLPLLAFWPLMIASITAVFIWGVVSQYGVEGARKMSPPPQPGSGVLETFPLTHLWFLYVLVWFYALVLAARAGIGALDRGQWLRGRLDALVRVLVESGLAPLVLAAPTAMALYVRKDWPTWLGVPTPDRGLAPNTAALAAFGAAFAFGWLLQRQPALLQVWRRRFVPHLAVAVALSAASVAIVGVTVRLDPAMQPAAQDPTLRLMLAVCYPLATWAWVSGLIGLAMRVLSEPRPAVRYLADASYWIYLVHLPIVMALQVAVFRLPLPALAKFALVVVVSVPPMLLSYHWMVRSTFVGAILNGRRHPRPGRASGASPAPSAAVEGASTS